MKYYEMHEEIYFQIKNSGKISWDNYKDFEEMFESPMIQTLNEFIDDFTNLNVLDLGTGTGNCALFCATRGAHSTGVDCSRSSLDIAHLNQQKLNVEVSWINQDITGLSLNKFFNLITDSSLLHCLVTQEDRQFFYSAVKKHLAERGFLYIHSMIQSQDMSELLKSRHLYFKDSTLWSLGMDQIKEGRIMINNQSYFPHRLILSEQELENELVNSGFKLKTKKIITQKNQPSLFCALFSL